MDQFFPAWDLAISCIGVFLNVGAWWGRNNAFNRPVKKVTKVGFRSRGEDVVYL